MLNRGRHLARSLGFRQRWAQARRRDLGARGKVID
jgi:hypothetical protein